ncbi:hypothetical protein SAMN05216296_2459 [Pseudomonas pohangensis]|uniref:Uncharacterized protein n=1 Tax=Pseudomonas pohangensis TaxID=364197 RepID=A0A1H2GQ42_9PSED|nr:hypothetical protein [Pseudomonas pohangensis]SDU21717.1 hypothetical protein SAMN05216296_2459 [Pseudomonas pohangensis]
MPNHYSEDDKERWAEEHFLPIDNSADNVALEIRLRSTCVKGSRYVDRLASSTNFHLHRIKNPNRYFTYFVNAATIPKLGTQKFRMIAENNGVRYTNEYLFATLLRQHVSSDVVEFSEILIKKYGIDLT